MENNPGKKLPKDYVKYPGKMDHATCVAFEVGLKKSDKEPPLHKKSNVDASQAWQEFKTPSGEKYFHNTITKKSTWEDPRFQLPNSDWKVYYNEEGEKYYFNSKTNESTWDLPKE
jgi:hypothetical protein